MKLKTVPAGKPVSWCAGVLVVMMLLGCSTTSSVSWDSRIGIYTWDDALAEFGLPDRVADLEGGMKTAEWIKRRSRAPLADTGTPPYARGETIDPAQTYGSTLPAKILRLSFTPDGKLIDWERNY